MRGVWLGLSCGALLLACTRQDVFACGGDDDCTLAGMPGFCESAGFCSFEDAACPSGRRFGKLAGDGLADECVSGDEAQTDSTSGTTTGSSTAESATLTSPPPSGTATTTSTTDATSSSVTTMQITDTGSSSGSTSTGSESSTSGSSSTGSSGGCEVWDFSDGMNPFEVLKAENNFEVSGGELRVTWGSADYSNATFIVASNVDMTTGSYEVDFSTLPMTQGTSVALRFLSSPEILTLFIDGPDTFGHYYDGADVVGIGSSPRMADETRLRWRVDDGVAVAEAETASGEIRELFVWSEGFPLGDTEVQLLFQRYENGNENPPEPVAATEVQLCVPPV